jgi:hypothetical protein
MMINMMIETCWSVLSVLVLTFYTNIVVYIYIYISALVGVCDLAN